MKKIVLFLLLAVVLVACGDKNSENSGGETDPYAGLTHSSYEAEGQDVATSAPLYETVHLYRNPSNNDRIEKARIEFKDSKVKVVADVKYNGNEVAGLEGTYTDENGNSAPVQFPAEDTKSLLALAEKEKFLPIEIRVR